MLAQYAAGTLLFRLRINPQVEHRPNGHRQKPVPDKTDLTVDKSDLSRLGTFKSRARSKKRTIETDGECMHMILTKEMIAASRRIFTKRSSNCSNINSQSGFPDNVT